MGLRLFLESRKFWGYGRTKSAGGLAGAVSGLPLAANTPDRLYGEALAMHETSFAHSAAIVGMAVLACAGDPARGAAGGHDSAAAPVPQGRGCGISTQSFKQLAVIEHAADDSFQCLGLTLDGQTVMAIRLETHRFSRDSAHLGAGHIDVLAFPPEVVRSTHGAVLDGVPGHDAIILRGALVGQSDPQHLMMSYLYNGFTGEYRSCQVTLEHAIEPGWRLVN